MKHRGAAFELYQSPGSRRPGRLRSLFVQGTQYVAGAAQAFHEFCVPGLLFALVFCIRCTVACTATTSSSVRRGCSACKQQLEAWTTRSSGGGRKKRRKRSRRGGRRRRRGDRVQLRSFRPTTSAACSGAGRHTWCTVDAVPAQHGGWQGAYSSGEARKWRTGLSVF